MYKRRKSGTFGVIVLLCVFATGTMFGALVERHENKLKQDGLLIIRS